MYGMGGVLGHTLEQKCDNYCLVLCRIGIIVVLTNVKDVQKQTRIIPS